MLITNNDILTKEKIFTKIKEIENIFESQKNLYAGDKEKVLHIIFGEDIIFINPLFLILLLNSHSKYTNQALAINTTYLSENKQIFIHRFLIQFFDYLYIETKNTKEKQFFDISDKAIAKSAKVRTDAGKRGLLYYYSVHIYKNIKSLSLNEDRKYGMLPIMSITDIIEKISLGHTEYEQDERIKIYNKLSSDDNQEELKNVLKIFLQLLHKQNKKDIFYINSLSMIIFEIIDNVKRHTKDKNNIPANGYISFHKDSSKNEAPYELTITDDFEDGFLNIYKIVLYKELRRLKSDFKLLGKKIDKDIHKSYIEDLCSLRKNTAQEDEKILKKLFDVSETFGIHQISRFSMHFGIPSLVKLLRKLNGELSVYLHRNSRYYKITFKEGITTFKQLGNDGIDGTYYHIKFPEYKLLSDEDDVEPTKLFLKNVNYQEIFKHRDILQTQVEEFNYISYSNLINIDDIYENKYIISSYKDFKKMKSKENTISDYIRNIYRYVNLHFTKDILIIDFPINEFKTYFHTLVDILYYKEDKDNTINIAILDDTSASALFIGGKDKKEFCYLNRVIAKNYNQKKDSFFKDYCYSSDENNENPFSASKLLIELEVKSDKKHFFLPFELFNINGKDILASMIETNLEKNKVNMHVDTGQNYHINYFYKFKNIFEDSNWVSRIAFNLAQKIPTKNLKMIGTNKYANAILASMFSIKKENEKYFVLNDFEENSLKALDRYIDKKNNFVVYSPVIFSGEKIKNDLIKKYLDKQIYAWYSTVKININDKKIENLSTLLNISLKNNDYEDVSKSKCDVCTSSEEGTLYKISKNNPFTIEKFNLENYRPKKIQSYCEKNEEITAKFFGSVYFGHTVRGNNHYTYYTKTIDFFEKNYENIKKFLEDSLLSIDENKSNIIFAPIHNTNSRFISLVNEIVFNNNATIYHFDKSNTEQNFYDIEDILIDINESNIYFVDDEISSAGTLRFFESLLKVMDENLNFDGVITMIDRTSPQDEKTINRLFKFKKIKIFTKLEIKPIKTDFGNCFLCQRRKEYLNMFDNSVLDMTRFQIAKRVVKLKSKKFDNVDYAKKDNFATKLKTFIKMSAVDFAHKKFELFENVELDADRSKKNRSIIDMYGEVENEFIDDVWDSLKINLKDTDLIKTEYFKAICNYESKIALLKSISFPKIVYFRLIREIATVVIVKRIKDIVNGDSPKYIYKNNDYSEFKIVDILSDKEEEEINNDMKKDSFKEFKDYLKNFRDKNGINYLNFLYRTAGYLNINQILDKENIRFFYEMTKELKQDRERFDDSHHMLHTYPFAVKMITSGLDTQYIYFKKNIEEFRRNNLLGFEDSKYSMIHALLLESGKDIKKEFKSEIDSWKTKNIKEKIDNLLKFIEVRTKNSMKVKSIYINENINIEYAGGYEEYLKSSKLIDVKNNFDELSRDNEEVYMLYQGALRSSGKFENLNYTADNYTKIDNTWANIPFSKDKEYFAIKLIDIDKKELENISDVEHVKKNTPIWFKPIGCIVVSFDGSYVNHLKFSELILSLQNEIVGFFKSEFKHKYITQMIDTENKVLIEKENYEKLLEKVRRISHSYKDYINIDNQIDTLIKRGLDCNKIIKKIVDFTNGLKYIFSLGSMNGNDSVSNEIFVDEILFKDNSFKHTIYKFLQTVPQLIDGYSGKYSINFEKKKEIEYGCSISSDEHLYNILFELIFNGIKNNKTGLNIKIILENNAIYIANNGKKIPNEDYEKIFNNEETTTGGLGVGLPKIRDYLKSVNMKIKVCDDNTIQENVVFKIYKEDD